MGNVWYLILLLPLLLLSGCSEGGFDVVAFIKNPVIMGIIFIAALYFIFKTNKR